MSNGRDDDRGGRGFRREPYMGGREQSDRDARERGGLERARGGDREREREGGRIFRREADMGGSAWSGASGRGGMTYEGGGMRGMDRGMERGRPYGARDMGGYRDGRGDRDFRDDRAGMRYGGEGGYGGDREGYGYGGGDRRFGGYGPDEGHPGDQERGREPGYGRGWMGREGGFARDRYGRGPAFAGSDFDARAYVRPSADRDDRDDRAYGMEASGGYGAQYGVAFEERGSDIGMSSPDHERWSERYQPRHEDRGPHYGKGPKGYKRSLDRVREDVCDAIAHQGMIDASDVEVHVEEGGVVVLRGTVAQRHHKRRLEQLVEHCRGVDEVRNELRVKRDEPRSSANETVREDARAQSPSLESPPGNGHRNGKSPRA